MTSSKHQLAALGLVLLGGAAAFHLQPTPRSARAPPSPSARALAYDDSYPSDSAEDSHFDVAPETTIDVDNKPATASEAAATTLIDRLPTSLSGEVAAYERAAINEAILRLEALNPTPDPVYSPLLNGVWTLRYAGAYSESKLLSPTRDLALFLYSGGYSPGLFALNLAQKLPAPLVELGDLEISISRAQPRVAAKVDVKLFGGREDVVEVRASLEGDSGLRFTEVYESASVLGQDVDLPEALQYSRDLYVAYVDEDLLIVRDGAGVPEILVRK